MLAFIRTTLARLSVISVLSIGENFQTSSMPKGKSINYFYRSESPGNGFKSTSTTPSNGSTLWEDKLRERYGIAQPMAPDDGLDPEEDALVESLSWRDER